ncbi:MAG: hypothetical protein COA79_21175 [Planctomycetota bacterium]|nr:MAG: hypothetical protein COA79_21175 [Planctomycetota bacterium]
MIFIIIITCLIAVIIALAVLYVASLFDHKKATGDLHVLEDKYENLKNEIKPLRKYSKIVDIELEIKALKSESDQYIKSETEKIKKNKANADGLIRNASKQADKVRQESLMEAQLIKNDAWKIRDDAIKESKRYDSIAKAMKNIVEGYGDEYLIPNHSAIDELAEEYGHREAGKELKRVRSEMRKMLKSDLVADCEYTDAYRRTTAIEFVVDAYGGKVDTIMSKIKHDNYGILRQELEDAYSIVNHNGKAFKNANIKKDYFNLTMDQLKFAVASMEVKRIEREEQRIMKEIIREEEKSRKEYEKARKEAEKEEDFIQIAMKEAQKKMAEANDKQKLIFEKELKELQEKLQVAEEKNKRALSMAQQTKQGHVYIISNIGSFGEDIFKIGMTRRLEPLDRVKELGDASVPFHFDVHALIHSEDAPALENELHKKFQSNQVNKVNSRKEFFNVGLKEIKEMTEKIGINVHWTMKAEALEYRETLNINGVVN